MVDCRFTTLHLFHVTHDASLNSLEDSILMVAIILNLHRRWKILILFNVMEVASQLKWHCRSYHHQQSVAHLTTSISNQFLHCSSSAHALRQLTFHRSQLNKHHRQPTYVDTLLLLLKSPSFIQTSSNFQSCHLEILSTIISLYPAINQIIPHHRAFQLLILLVLIAIITLIFIKFP